MSTEKISIEEPIIPHQTFIVDKPVVYEDFLDLLHKALSTGQDFIEVDQDLMDLCVKHNSVDLADKFYYVHGNVRVYLKGKREMIEEKEKKTVI